MHKTFAYNSVIIGFLVGLLVYVSTQNLILGAITLIGVSVVGFVVIRVIENLVSKGVDAAVDAATSSKKRVR